MDKLSYVNIGRSVDCAHLRAGQTVRMGKRSPRRNGIKPDAVAERIVRARLALGFEQSAHLADALAVDRSAWLKYEKGERIIPAPIAHDFAERFGVTMEYVYRGRTETIVDQELRSRIIDARK